MTSPFLFNWIFLREPEVLIPPLAKIALVNVDNELTVYIPGWNASPRTKTLMDLRAPRLTVASVPIIFELTAF